MCEKWIWGTLGLHFPVHLKGVWDGLGTLWPALGWLLLDFLAVQNRPFSIRGSQMGFKSLLDLFWKNIGTLGEGLGRVGPGTW